MDNFVNFFGIRRSLKIKMSGVTSFIMKDTWYTCCDIHNLILKSKVLKSSYIYWNCCKNLTMWRFIYCITVGLYTVCKHRIRHINEVVSRSTQTKGHKTHCIPRNKKEVPSTFSKNRTTQATWKKIYVRIDHILDSRNQKS